MRTDYQPQANEKHLVHVEFIQIRMVGDETQRFPKIQKFHPREWDNMKRHIDENGLKTTMQNRVEVVYDPRVAAAQREKDVAEKRAKAEAEANAKKEAREAEAKKAAEVKPEAKPPKKED